MLALLSKFVLLGSSVGMLFITIRRIPDLVKLPQNIDLSHKKDEFVSGNKGRGNFFQLLSFSKLFSSRIKKPATKKKMKNLNNGEDVNFSEDYWEKIRKS
ncbi:hypothetical protein J7J81_02640 [bacterium]|nr:hypothetical protein [bacterium]